MHKPDRKQPVFPSYFSARIVGALWLLIALGACSAESPSETARPLSQVDSSEPIRVGVDSEALDPAFLPVYSDGAKKDGLQRQIDLHTIMPDRPRMEVVTYLVQRGDTLFGISDKFGIKPESVLWGNWETMEGDP
ncbi:MAG: LysM domain-containing protein, partial [Anaerolineales bacterium]